MGGGDLCGRGACEKIVRRNDEGERHWTHLGALGGCKDMRGPSIEDPGTSPDWAPDYEHRPPFPQSVGAIKVQGWYTTLVMLSRQDVLQRTADRTGIPKHHLEEVLRTVFDVIGESLAEGKTVKLKRFGVFSPRVRRAGTRLHPRTGAAIDVPERHSVGFLPSATLKARLNP